MHGFRIKIADSDREREQIHALNYSTFVEEIPQHHGNAARRLVDRFDAENTYIVALDESDNNVVGMLALRAKRPFSLDTKLADLDEHLPPYRSVCEVRLLSVRPEHRGGRLFADLVRFAARIGIGAGHDLAVISGTTRQLRLYTHLGFVPFGPRVGTPEAPYQPMYLALESFVARTTGSLRLDSEVPARERAVSFLPGPTQPFHGVAHEVSRTAISHRDPVFLSTLTRVRSRLCALTGADHAIVLLGSGTLANDAVAAAIAAEGGRGLLCVNGEFGERLTDQARRAGLAFDVLALPWGEAFDEMSLARAAQSAQAQWIWAVHCETSTGVLNDLAMMKRVASRCGCKLHLDCISSVGTVGLDLSGVRFASCASGKGLGAYPGLSMVLVTGTAPAARTDIPRYLDLAYWLQCDGVPFTHSSNLVAGLNAALSARDFAAHFARTARHACWLRNTLKAHRLDVLAPEHVASPGVTTVVLSERSPVERVGATLERDGYVLSWRSHYLRKRNWLQIALMGDYDGASLRGVPAALAATVQAESIRPSRRSRG